MKIRVAHLIETLDIGGAEAVLADIVNNLDERFAPSVICLKNSGPVAERIKGAAGPVIEIGKREGNDPFAILRLASVLRRDGIDILHTHNWGVFCEGVAAAVIAGIPGRVHTVHGPFRKYPAGFAPALKKRLRHGVERLLSSLKVNIVAVSEDVKSGVVSVLDIPGERVHVIINGISAQALPRRPERIMREFSIGPDERIVVSVGRLAEIKNFPMLIEAAAMVRSIRPFRLLIAGDGPERSRLERMARESGLSNVRFLGARRDVRELLSAADVFAMSSDYEGTSVALLEAMSAGLPAIVTDVGGNPALVADGLNGYLVRPRDSAGMARALSVLIDGIEAAEEMGRAGAAIVKNRFSLDRTVSAYEELYLAALGKADKIMEQGVLHG